MTKNKICIAILVIVIAVQLLVPAGFIANKYDVLYNGTEYKFRVSGYDPYDVYRGSYVALSVVASDSVYGVGRYGVIKLGSDGFATVNSILDEKPHSGDYVVSSGKYSFEIPIDRYYTDADTALALEQALREISWDSEIDAYVTVRVKNGNAVVSGLYINDIPAEEYAERIINNTGGESFA